MFFFFCWSCFFSVCSPTSPRSLGRSSPNLVGRLRAAPDISSRGSFLKVNVIEVKGHISVSQQSLVLFARNLVSVYRLIPDKDLWVQLCQRSSRSRSNLFFFFCLFLPGPWADLHPKLGGKVEGGPGY